MGAPDVRLCQAPGCSRPVHPARQEASPHTVTCSAECSAARLAELRRRNSERWRVRKREANAARARAWDMAGEAV